MAPAAIRAPFFATPGPAARPFDETGMPFPNKLLLTTLCLLAPLPHALAGHPFVTDDTSTQGRGHRQFEANTDWAKQNGESLHVANFTYSYGSLPNLDIFANLPIASQAATGLGDVSGGIKWRFYEHAATSLALKSSLLLPSGNQRLGNGSGLANLALTLIGSHYATPWALHGNLGISSNRQAADSTQAGERQLLWQMSAAVSYDLTLHWKALADIGISRNPNASSDTYPAYFLTGLIYSPQRNLDLDAGLKFGLNQANDTRQFGIGLTWRF